MVRVLIESGDGENDWGTVGVSENIVEASWKALVDSIDYKLLKDEAKRAAEARDRYRSGEIKSNLCFFLVNLKKLIRDIFAANVCRITQQFCEF